MINSLPKIPLKKQAELVKIITHRPGNFLFIRRELYMQLIQAVGRLEENSMMYTDIMVSLATLMANAPITR